MPPTLFDRPPSPWDADDRSVFAPVSRISGLVGRRLGQRLLARLAAALRWRRRWTP